MKLPFLSLVNKRLIEAADESIIFEKTWKSFLAEFIEYTIYSPFKP